jgi:hypothetical protein
MKSQERPDGESLLRGLDVPHPPLELRARVLDAARTGARVSPAADAWSRLWHSRSFRLAWAGAVVLLLAGHAALSGDRSAVRAAFRPDRVVERRVDEQLADLLRPVRISEGVQPIVGLAADPEPLELDAKGNPS